MSYTLLGAIILRFSFLVYPDPILELLDLLMKLDGDLVLREDLLLEHVSCVSEVGQKD